MSLRSFVLAGAILFFSFSTAFSWEVEPGSKGNELFLEVRNSSKQPVRQVFVEVYESPGWIQFGTAGVMVGEVLAPEETQNAMFLFDVVKAAPLEARGKIRLLVKCTGGSWRKEVVVTVIPSASLPKVTALHQSSPNPFRQSAVIRYQLSERARTSLRIYNLAGRLVKTLVNKEELAGSYEVEWGGANETDNVLPNGTYFCRLDAGDFTCTRKLILLR